jgi:hypothetical protein
MELGVDFMKAKKTSLILFLLVIISVFLTGQVLAEDGSYKSHELTKSYNLIYDTDIWGKVEQNKSKASVLTLRSISSKEKEKEKASDGAGPVVADFKKLSLPRQYSYEKVKKEFIKTKDGYYSTLLENENYKSIVEVEQGRFNRSNLRTKYYITRIIHAADTEKEEDNLETKFSYRFWGFIYHPKIQSDLITVVGQSDNFNKIRSITHLLGNIQMNEEVFTEKELEKIDQILKFNKEFFQSNSLKVKRKFK